MQLLFYPSPFTFHINNHLLARISCNKSLAAISSQLRHHPNGFRHPPSFLHSSFIRKFTNQKKTVEEVFADYYILHHKFTSSSVLPLPKPSNPSSSFIRKYLASILLSSSVLNVFPVYGIYGCCNIYF